MAIWEKLFSKITFKNYPDTSTPINADNLNKMTDAIDGIDNRVIELISKLNGVYHSSITSGNADEITDIGYYFVNNTNGDISNIPIKGFCFLEVYKALPNSKFPIQKITRYSDGKTYTRAYNNGWSEWATSNYKAYEIESYNNTITNINVKLYANSYECKLNGFIQLPAGTHISNMFLFTLPEGCRPSYIVYMPHSLSSIEQNSAFRVDTDGNVYLNGQINLDTARYIYFNGSFNI